MRFEKVIYAFLIILALSLNLSFYLGEIDNSEHHNIYLLAATLIVSLVCTVLKFGDRSSFGATALASSLVAVIMLIAAASVWFFSPHFTSEAHAISTMTSLAAGALIANVLSVVLLILETSQFRR